MFRFTLRQLRRSLRQVIGGAMAIVVATGFIAATLAGSAVMSRTIQNVQKEPYAGADLVVGRADYYDAQYLPAGAADAARGLALVGEVFQPVQVTGEVRSGSGGEWGYVRTISNQAALGAWPASEGREPAAVGEATMAASVAERLKVALGDEVELALEIYSTSADTVWEADSEPDGGASGDQPEAGAAAEAEAAASGTDGEAGLDQADGGAEAELAASDADGDGQAGGESVAEVYEPSWRTATLQVTGLFDDSVASFFTNRPTLLTTPETVAALGLLDSPDIEFPYYEPGALLLTLAPGAEDTPDARQQVFDALAQAWASSDWAAECPGGFSALTEPDQYNSSSPDLCGLLVMSPDEAGKIRAAATLDDNIITAVVLAFALISLLTGAMVIANTFQVTIAGRARTLALLRAVGATGRQIRRSVLIEALVTGLIASGVGIAGGWGLIQLALGVARRLYPSVPLPAGAVLSPGAVLAALAVGAGATVLASLVPARLASRVAPVDALRPQGAPSLSAPAGRARLSWSIVLSAVGAAMLGVAVWWSASQDPNRLDDLVVVFATLLGVLGGAVMAAGIIIGSVFWLPKLVGRVASVIGRSRGGTRIAAANVVRNPRRTAASATALMVGMTLVSSLMVGAAGFNHSFDVFIEAQQPVDLQIGYYWGGTVPPGTSQEDLDSMIGEAVPPELIERIEAVPGVEDSAPISVAAVEIEDDLGASNTYLVSGVDPERLRATLAIPDLIDQLRPNVVVVDSFLNENIALMSRMYSEDWSEEDAGVVAAPASPTPVSGTSRVVRSAGGESVELAFVHEGGLDCVSGWCAAMMADQATLDALGGGRVAAVMFSVDESADAIAVQNEVLELVTGSSMPGETIYQVWGGAVEKAEARKALSTMLLIGLALLAVSLLVALIGISNTLSLSVIERRHETALLRALGLTRGQTRWMLAVEALVVAGIAGLMGILFGTLYGFAACAIMLVPTMGMALMFPVWGIAALFGLILAAGLLASVLPGHRAARVAPAAALAPE
ncbi:MAG: ABC transporter permease [Bifidobacteriaceae bacterium]|jgi:putative ABC transport system permease protein|nr:ABC transporter permease [Bifidobacteriaceae bacterium]